MIGSFIRRHSGAPGFQSRGRDRVLGHDEQAGLACVRAESAGDCSRAYQPGPYSPRESIPAAWDREYLRHIMRSRIASSTWDNPDRRRTWENPQLQHRSSRHRALASVKSPLAIAGSGAREGCLAAGHRADDEEGSLPLAIASGSGASGDSWEKSSPQQKKRTSGRRFWSPDRGLFRASTG